MAIWETLLGVAGGWLERLTGGWLKWREIDTRIADGARRLRRELMASYENWPTGLQTLTDCTDWAGAFLRGMHQTDATLETIEQLRGQASPSVSKLVVRARDEYQAAAKIVNRLFKGGGLSIQWHERAEVEAALRRAFTHLQNAITALSELAGKG